MAILRLFAIAISIEIAVGALKDQISFHSPFTHLDSDGKRAIQNWNVDGSAQIQKGFVRITPDRQSKQGYMWTNQPIGSEEFTVIFQFRISGQGQRFFGDGIALWISQTSHYSGGNLHGAPEAFNGLGVIMDTFKNTETAALHKDVTVFVNNGQKNTDEMQKVAVGCDASMRYHEKRADFSPTNSSRIKVQYNRGFLKISVDAKASGTWESCTEIPQVDLPVDFANGAYLGISAATGALADNHDVIGLSVYDSSDDEEAILKDSEVAHNARPVSERHGGDEVSTLKANMETFKLELEHKLTAVNDGLVHSFKKLQKQEDDMEKRLKDLEEKFAQMVAERVETHVNEKISSSLSDVHTAVLDTVHGNIHDTLNQRLAETEERTRAQFTEHAKATLASVSSGGGWKMPFAFLVLFMAAVVFFGYQKYQEMKKSHLL